MYLTEECRMLVTELRKGKQPEDLLFTRNVEPVYVVFDALGKSL